MHESEFWSIFQQTLPLYTRKAEIPSFQVGGWSLFQQTRPLYTKPFLSPPPPPPPPVIEWPRKIYVATKLMGVYYTENFDGISQPLWTRVNDGLATLDCLEFHLDPFDQENMQFVLTTTGGVLYRRRNRGNWEAVLNNAIRQALCGQANTGERPGGFCFDPTIQGRVWMVTTSSQDCEMAFCSDDYGDTWDVGWIYCGPYTQTGTIRAYGNYAWSSDAAGVGTYGYMLWTSDRNQHWSWQTVDLVGLPHIEYNPLSPTSTYYATPNFGHNVGYFQNAGNYGLYISDHSLTFNKPGQMWYSATVFGHQRIIHDSRLHVTNDNWATHSYFGDYVAIQLLGTIAPWAGDNENHMLVETSGDHLISALHSEDDLIPTGMAGSSPGVAPYVNSIPKGTVSGFVCYCGIQAVREAGIVYA